MSECPECRQPLEPGARFCPSCGAAAGAASAPPPDPFVGRTVNGKFRVEALLGQGGMGRVYRARHLTLDRPVVLKMLHAAYSDDPQIVQRFQREARAASRLDHPNSIAVLDFGAAEDGTLFMAMEYLAGRDLAHVIAAEFPLGTARIVRIGAQVLSALAEAHAQGVIHRDLKPENVMVEPRRGESDFVKVLDFGIAKITSPGAGEPKLTQAGLVCGTPEYMSPEQARGADLDARSDLYSVGVILYQMATGDLPFQSDTPVGFLTKHLAETPVPPRERRPDLAISPALDALVAKALEKDVAKRFQSADEMREALLACAAPARAPAPPPPPPSPGRSATVQVTLEEPIEEEAPPARSRKPFWFFAAAMLVAVVGGGSIVVLVKKTAAERQETFRAQAEPAAPAAVPVPAPVSPLTPALSPAGAGERETGTREAAGAGETGTSKAAVAAEKETGTDAAKARAADLFRQAEARRATQDTTAAIPLYLAALDADPALAEAEKKVALCFQLEGDKAKAALHYQRYLATDPPDAARVKAVLATLQ